MEQVGGIACTVFLHFRHPATEFLCIDRVFNYAVWFYLGNLISEEKLVEKYLYKNALMTMIAGIGIYIIGIFTDVFVTTMGGITLSFGLAMILDKYMPNTFYSFRDYTYQIFLMGVFVQKFVKIMYDNITMSYGIGFIVCILAGLYVPVPVSKIVEKINWKPLSLCLGLK